MPNCELRLEFLFGHQAEMLNRQIWQQSLCWYSSYEELKSRARNIDQTHGSGFVAPKILVQMALL